MAEKKPSVVGNIERIFTSPDYSVYRTTCHCMSEDHDLTVESEYDNKLNLLSLTFSINCICHGGIALRWYHKLWNRIKMAIRLIFTGYIQRKEYFMFRDKEHIDSLITILTEARDQYKSGI